MDPVANPAVNFNHELPPGPAIEEHADVVVGAVGVNHDMWENAQPPAELRQASQYVVHQNQIIQLNNDTRVDEIERAIIGEINLNNNNNDNNNLDWVTYYRVAYAIYLLSQSYHIEGNQNQGRIISLLRGWVMEILGEDDDNRRIALQIIDTPEYRNNPFMEETVEEIQYAAEGICGRYKINLLKKLQKGSSVFAMLGGLTLITTGVYNLDTAEDDDVSWGAIAQIISGVILGLIPSISSGIKTCERGYF